MEKTDTKTVDIYKKFNVIRDDDVEINRDTEKSNAQRILTKKVLNIPICDVHTDAEYDKKLKSSFSLPVNYVKHFKKIGDEVDVSLDYIVDTSDRQWVAGRIRSEPGKDVSKVFTLDAFETIINILEKYTAVSRDPIPLVNAQKLILEQLSWSSQQLINLIGDVYKYWLRKREQLGKPLCRRYWPQVASSDSNPHQVFRTRDKERYRLRKQQKRNDVESFRKMQQLRREFSKAKVLSELIQERELLCQADFELQRELFEQRLFDLAPPEGDRRSSVKRRREVPFRHALKFDYINPDDDDLLEVVARSNKASSSSAGYAKLVNLASSSDESEDDEAPSAGLKQGANGPTTKKNGSAASAAGSSSAVEKKTTNPLASTSALVSAESAKKKTGGEQKKGRRKDSSRVVLYTVTNGVTTELAQPAAAPGSEVATSIPLTGATAVEGDLADGAGLENRLIHPDLDGPATLCQPLWPSFMAELAVRDSMATSTQRSLSNYMRDLEFRRDGNGEVILPDKYRSRCRVGRGGRLVVDRIPVYSVEHKVVEDYWSVEEPEKPEPLCTGNQRYVYPTSTRYRQQLALAAAAAAAETSVPPERTSLGSVNIIPVAPRVVSISPADSVVNQPGTSQSPTNGLPIAKAATRPLSEVPFSNRKLRSYNVKIRQNNALLTSAPGVPTVAPQKLLPTELPSFMPPARLMLTSQVKQKLNEICNESDSEDERVLIPRALKGYPELELRSAITKASLAAAQQSGPGAVGSASLDNPNPCSKSNVKHTVYV